MSMSAHRWVPALLLLVTACSSSDAEDRDPSTSETVAASTTLEVAAPSTLAPTSTTSTVPPSTLPAVTAATSTAPASTVADTVAPGPLEFVDGTFLGIAQGTPLADAAAALSATPQPLDPSVTVFACTGTADPSVIQSGGLTLVFESWEGTPAVLTNWMYVGGAVGRFTEMVAPRGIRIGDTRDQVIAAFPDFMDVGDIAVFDPPLRFGIEDDVVAWFGIIDCVFEGGEPAG